MPADFSIRQILTSVTGVVSSETTPYVYLLVDTQSGKWYIGCRTARGCHPRELGISYFTSSKIVKPLFRATPSRFRASILYVGFEATAQESKMLKLMNAKANIRSYNLQNGDGSFDAKKAAELTVALGVGVHARSSEQMTKDSLKMVEKHKAAKTGIFTPGAGDKGRATQALLGLAAFNSENRSKGGVTSGNNAKLNKTGIHALTKDQRVVIGKKALSAKYRCIECGVTLAAPHLANHQKYKHHNGKEVVV